MTTGRLLSHHCHIARGLLTLILSIGHELLVFASFFVNVFKTIYQKKKKNNNSKASRFENRAMQNLHGVISLW